MQTSLQNQMHQNMQSYISIFESIIISLQNTIMEKLPKCINNSSATHICVNESCNRSNPFVCGANHDCNQHHKTCMKLSWITFKEKLEQNRQTFNSTFMLICEKVVKVITQGIQQLKAELDDFNKWKKQYGDVKKIVEFYKSIQLNREETWTGKDICRLNNNKIKFNKAKIEIVMAQIEQKKIEFMKMIRELYQGEDQVIIKIKSYYLYDLNKKLKHMKQQPKHLELKFVERMIYLGYKSIFIQLFVMIIGYK